MTVGDWSELVPKITATFRYHNESMGATKGDMTPKIAQYHHCPGDIFSACNLTPRTCGWGGISAFA